MIYVGIDPGERWSGFALLQPVKKSHLVQTGVIDGRDNMYAPVDLLKEIFRRHSDVHVVAEDYRVRPVGHQRFTRANTARILGAIEYTTQDEKGTWHLEPAADPDTDLELLGLSEIIERWRKQWPKRKSSNWHHARSSWRVLAMHLLRHQPEMIQGLKMVRVSSSQTSYTIERGLWAPPARWG